MEQYDAELSLLETRLSLREGTQTYDRGHSEVVQEQIQKEIEGVIHIRM
jgi:hypothetical protein